MGWCFFVPIKRQKKTDSREAARISIFSKYTHHFDVQPQR